MSKRVHYNLSNNMKKWNEWYPANGKEFIATFSPMIKKI